MSYKNTSFLSILPTKAGEKMYFSGKFQKKWVESIADSKNISTFATAKTKWEVLYGQLLVNPPGLDRSKGSRS